MFSPPVDDDTAQIWSVLAALGTQVTSTQHHHPQQDQPCHQAAAKGLNRLLVIHTSFKLNNKTHANITVLHICVFSVLQSKILKTYTHLCQYCNTKCPWIHT
jgi:hypothetical protein